MRKLLLILFVGMFLVSFTSAEVNPCGNNNAYLNNFKTGQNISLQQICDTCTYVNISTISYPNSTILTINQSMTKNGISYNYSFTDTSLLGCYSYSVFGDKDGTLTAEVIDFQITPSGFINTLGFYLLILALSLGIIIFGYYAQDATIVVLGAFGLGFIAIYLFFYGIDGFKDSIYTQSISFILTALSAYLLFRGSIEFLN